MNRINKVIWGIFGVSICLAAGIMYFYKNGMLSSFLQQPEVYSCLSFFSFAIGTVIIVMMSCEMSYLTTQQDERLQVILNKSALKTLKYLIFSLIFTPGIIQFMGLQGIQVNISLLPFFAVMSIVALY